MDDIKTLADTIVWLAKQREDKCQNLNSAIHAVSLEVDKYLCEAMKNNLSCDES